MLGLIHNQPVFRIGLKKVSSLGVDNCVKLLGIGDGETFDQMNSSVLRNLGSETWNKSGTWYPSLSKEF